MLRHDASPYFMTMPRLMAIMRPRPGPSRGLFAAGRRRDRGARAPRHAVRRSSNALGNGRDGASGENAGQRLRASGGGAPGHVGGRCDAERLSRRSGGTSRCAQTRSRDGDQPVSRPVIGAEGHRLIPLYNPNPNRQGAFSARRRVPDYGSATRMQAIRIRKNKLYPSGILAGAAGLEPATYGFGDRRSTD